MRQARCRGAQLGGGGGHLLGDFQYGGAERESSRRVDCELLSVRGHRYPAVVDDTGRVSKRAEHATDEELPVVSALSSRDQRG